MKIHNLRFGFATNSSSSHSIVFVPMGVPLPREAGQDDNYGWDDFTLVSQQAKRNYLKAQFSGEGLDHQSVWNAEGLSLRDRLSGKSLSADDEFMGRLLGRERTVVLGGNDNSSGHPLAAELRRQGAAILGQRRYEVVHDPKGHIVLFDKEYGTKMRVTLDGDDVPQKGTWPELVDVKITDYCPYGCSFCYQGSTKKGQHASVEVLEKLAKKMKRSGVLEVALGGGEPTLHPEFEKIVKLFSNAGLVVNVTSRNIPYWVERAEKKSIVKAVAFSVDSLADVKKVKAAFEGTWTEFQRHYQLVVGVATDEEFGQILEEVDGHRLTLLGYKTTGRGEKAKAKLPVFNSPKQNGWIAPWLERVRIAQESEDAYAEYDARMVKLMNSNYQEYSRQHNENKAPKIKAMPEVAIDTTLALHCKEDLAKKGVPSVLYHTSEGAFSLYVDAVSETYGPCSYTPDLMRPLKVESLWEDFAKMESVG